MLAAPSCGEPGAAAILDQMYAEADKVTHAPAGSAILGRYGPSPSGMVPAAPKDPQFKVETVDRPDGTYQITTNTLTGESKAAKLEGVPGKPAFAPQRPEQPNASRLYISTIEGVSGGAGCVSERRTRARRISRQSRSACGTRSTRKPADRSRRAQARRSLESGHRGHDD